MLMTSAAQVATHAIIVQRARGKDAVATSLEMITASQDLLRRLDEETNVKGPAMRGTIPINIS